MNIHFITCNSFFRLGLLSLASKKGLFINAITPENRPLINEIKVNDLVIFHIDRYSYELLREINVLTRLVKVVLLNPHNLNLGALYDVDAVVDYNSPLNCLLNTITKTAESSVWRRKRHRSLTAREQDVIMKTLDGDTVAQIAKIMGLPPKLIYNYRYSAYKKFGVTKVHDILPLKNNFIT